MEEDIKFQTLKFIELNNCTHSFIRIVSNLTDKSFVRFENHVFCVNEALRRN